MATSSPPVRGVSSEARSPSTTTELLATTAVNASPYRSQSCCTSASTVDPSASTSEAPACSRSIAKSRTRVITQSLPAPAARLAAKAGGGERVPAYLFISDSPPDEVLPALRAAGVDVKTEPLQT